MAGMTDASEQITWSLFEINGIHYEMKATPRAIALAVERLKAKTGELFGVRELCRYIIAEEVLTIYTLAWAMLLPSRPGLTVDAVMLEVPPARLGALMAALMQAFYRIGWISEARPEDGGAEKNATSTGETGSATSSAD